MFTNSCYSIVANLDGIDMNDQDAKWSYAKRGCSSAFEQETETIFFKAWVLQDGFKADKSDFRVTSFLHKIECIPRSNFPI